MTLYQYDTRGVNLPGRKIPNTATLYAFNLVCRKYPLALPVLLKYLIHNDLLEDAKDDLEKIYRKLQSVMAQDLTNLKKQKDEFQLIRETSEIASCKNT